VRVMARGSGRKEEAIATLRARLGMSIASASTGKPLIVSTIASVRRGQDLCLNNAAWHNLGHCFIAECGRVRPRHVFSWLVD